jgi:hypothetical protein
MHIFWTMQGAEERIPQDTTACEPMQMHVSSELKTCAGGGNGTMAAVYYADRNYDYATKLLAKYHGSVDQGKDEKTI